jgi:hypothetical protein
MNTYLSDRIISGSRSMEVCANTRERIVLLELRPSPDSAYYDVLNSSHRAHVSAEILTVLSRYGRRSKALEAASVVDARLAWAFSAPVWGNGVAAYPVHVLQN